MIFYVLVVLNIFIQIMVGLNVFLVCKDARNVVTKFNVKIVVMDTFKKKHKMVLSNV